MIRSKGKLPGGEHIWVIYRGKLVLGVVLDSHIYKHHEDTMYRIIISISSSKCSVIVRGHSDPGIFNLEDRETAEIYLERTDEKNLKKKPRKFFIRKNYKLQK